jgi:catechol 2,3-dioxygenase-like lactoylglutathione lyase family enzyme
MDNSRSSPTQAPAPGAVPFQAAGLDHIVLRVHDLDRMLAFYTQVLGCILEREQRDLGLFQLRAGGCLIDLVTIDGKLGRAGGAGPGEQGRNLDHFCLGVSPFDDAAIRRHLAAHGVQIGSTAIRYGAGGHGPSIYLRDPEGNGIELKQVAGAGLT